MVEKNSITIIVPRVLPSWNVVRKMNPHDYKRMREGWQADIYHLIPFKDREWLKAMATLGKKMRVQFECERKRLIDPDNQCVKHVLDALRNLGFLSDDDARHLEPSISQRKGPTMETTIRIREA